MVKKMIFRIIALLTVLYGNLSYADYSEFCDGSFSSDTNSYDNLTGYKNGYIKSCKDENFTPPQHEKIICNRDKYSSPHPEKDPDYGYITGYLDAFEDECAQGGKTEE